MPDLSLFDLTGQKALVTGAAGGIGRGCAIALAKAGADVAIVDINEKTGLKTVEEIRAMGRDSLWVRCDVTRREEVQEMVRRVAERFGRLDIAVNNAGIGILGADETLEQADWDKVIAVNLTGVFLCAQAEAQQMLRQTPIEGKIINIASMSATIANCNASYDASKAGVVHMTKTLAAEWGRYNINVNCISPSYLLTPMHASTPLIARQRIRDLTPMGYVERPEDLHGAVIFLASAASHYVTGHDLMVDGGHTLNAWLTPLGRAVPPRVAPEQETVQLKHDLDALGLPYDADGINPNFHPEIADAFKAAFGIKWQEPAVKLSASQLARMMDLSAVRADVGLAEVCRLAETAKTHHCVCAFVMPCYLAELRQLLADAPDVGIGGVVGFPSGATSTAGKAAEARQQVEQGATELDMVINVGMLLSGCESYVADDIHAVVEAAGKLPVKVILEAHYLSDDQIVKACEIAVGAGAAFVKTGTGWAPSGATLHNVALMKATVGDKAQVKAAGGVRDLDTVVEMIRRGVSRFGVGLESGVKILQQCAAMPGGAVEV